MMTDPIRYAAMEFTAESAERAETTCAGAARTGYFMFLTGLSAFSGEILSRTPQQTHRRYLQSAWRQAAFMAQ